MMILIIACGIFAMGFAVVLIKYVLLRRDLSQMAEALDVLSDADTNAQLRTTSFDRIAIAFSSSINKAIAHSRKEYNRMVEQEVQLKQAMTNISHDLRTPLTSAKGYMQIISASETDDATREKYLNIISGRLERLSALMDNLFEYTQISEGRQAMHLSMVNVCNLVRDVLSVSYVELINRGFTVDAHIPEVPVYVRCDADALLRVLQNLIKNAYIHGTESLSIVVSDNKISIANKVENITRLDVTKLFDRFYTADASRTKQTTGIGLAIAYELMQQMNGRLNASVHDEVLVMEILFHGAGGSL